MKFKLFGTGIEVSHLNRREAAEDDRLTTLNDEVLAQVPRLRRDGRVQFGGLGALLDQGWTVEEIADIVDSWPQASYLSLTLIVSIAGQIREQGTTQVEDINAWMHAICEQLDDGKVLPRQLVRAELEKAGLPRNPTGAVKLWSDAAGSPEAGLTALANGQAASGIER